MPTCKQGACEVYVRDNVRAALAESEAGADVISYCKTCGSQPRSVASVKALHTVVWKAKNVIGQVTKLLAKFWPCA